MDSEGNIYLVGDDDQKKKFLESLKLDSKYTERHVSKSEARKKGLMPINRPITRAEMGGTHYKTEPGKEEHWDRQFRMFGPAYFIGCITKYVERYAKKNGIEDLRKAAHFIEKLIELEKAEAVNIERQAAEEDDRQAMREQAEERRLQCINDETHQLRSGQVRAPLAPAYLYRGPGLPLVPVDSGSLKPLEESAGPGS